MKKLHLAIVFILIFVCSVWNESFALSYEELCSENYMLALRQDLLNISQSNLSDVEKKNKLEERLVPIVTSDNLAKAIFGLQYSEFTQSQAAELKTALGTYFIKRFQDSLLKHMTSQVIFIRLSEKEDAPYCLIRARVGKTVQERIDVSYKLYVDKDEMHIIDIGVNGLSIAMAQREYFNNLMTVKKFTPENVLAELEQYNLNN